MNVLLDHIIIDYYCEGCKIVTSLIKISNTARNDLDIAQRQLDVEKKKTARNQATAKIELLQAKLSEV